MCEKCGYDHTEKNARKLWRKYGFGRLYKKHNNRNWHNAWLYSDFSYCAKQSTVSIYFKNAGDVIHDCLGIED